MEPKYKLHGRITEASKWKLPPISQKQMQWGYGQCLDKYYHISRGKFYCLECGHSWKAENSRKLQTCPNCSNKLRAIKNYRTSIKEAAYMSVITVCEGFQVIRIVWVSKHMKLNTPAYFFGSEVMQHWVDEQGNATTMAKNTNGMSAACDAWTFGSELKVRQNYGSYKQNYRHNISPNKSYPEMKILQVYKRNGFKGEFHDISPLEFFRLLLVDNHFETLLKSKQYSLLRLCVECGIYNVWPSIKICIRNKFIVKDARIWRDYIDLLKYFRKDIHNAHFVCTRDVKAEHDKLVQKKRREEQQREIKQQREEMMKANAQYIPSREKFFDIILSDGELKIVVLDNVEEFAKEGDELHHCVFANRYYAKPDSLILSARKNDERIETVEVSLTRMEIVQCRGKFNKLTDYHDQIINLVNQNIEKIAQRV